MDTTVVRSEINQVNRNIGLNEEKLEELEGTKRICEVCREECTLHKLHCENCIRNFLREKFSSWTSGNEKIDELIRKCQMETLAPDMIIEWIPYDNLQNVKYLTKGGYSEIFTADWIDGSYNKWDIEKQELQRNGTQGVILKKSKSFKSVEQNCFFKEAELLLSVSNKWENLVKCYGITQDPVSENYILVMKQMDTDLRKYLQQNHNQLTWKERINIVYIIIYALSLIHNENEIHGDLHSGNILYKEYSWYISDIAFRGPANKPSESIYGNLPYIAPEVIADKEYTKASDIYSIAMLMWEISSGQPPFNNYEYDFDVTMKIISGVRPKIVPETPVEYKKLMQQCWDANPSNRPDGNTLKSRIKELRELYKNEEKELKNQSSLQLQTSHSLDSNNNQIRNTSKIYIFKNLPKPKNAPEMEQEDGGENIYSNPNLHSEDQDELEIPEIEDMDELYNKGINDDSNVESEKTQFKINAEDENENETIEKETDENETIEKETDKNETSEKGENEINKNEVITNIANESDLMKDDFKKSKNKKNFVGTVRDKFRSKFVKSNPDKKDKKVPQ